MSPSVFPRCGAYCTLDHVGVLVTTGEWLPSLCASRSSGARAPRVMCRERYSRSDRQGKNRSGRIESYTLQRVPYRTDRTGRAGRAASGSAGCVIQCVVIGIHRLWAIAAPVLRCCQYVNVSVGPKRERLRLRSSALVRSRARRERAGCRLPGAVSSAVSALAVAVAGSRDGLPHPQSPLTASFRGSVT